MKTRTKAALITVPVAVVAFLLSPILFPPAEVGAGPTSAQIPFFVFLGVGDAVLLGLGVSFLVFGYPVLRRVSPDSKARAWAMYLSIAYLMVSWWPDGTPITWPLTALWRPGEGRFALTTSIGLPQKAFNIRRDPRVSLLFSDPTASGLERPPAVLVQGDAEAPDEIQTSPNHLPEYWRRLFEIQPAGKIYGSNRLMRYLMDWYYMRLYISVRPRRILFWPRGDFAQEPLEVEVDHVG